MSWDIPLFDIQLGRSELAAVTRVLESNWLSTGPETSLFENEFQAYINAPYALAVASCTSALYLCLKGLDVGRGDEVVCPSLNFCACPNVVVTLGADVVFADVTSPDDLCLSPQDVAAKITPRTKAIVAMHYAGHPCDMTALNGIARRHGVYLIEDAAHAPGAQLDDVKCGSLADAACFSFYANKNMTTGEGGMITTARRSLAERLRLLRSHGMTVPTLDRHEGHAFSYDLAEPGFNFRMDEIRAALGRAQLEKLDAANTRRRQLARRYRERLRAGDLSLPFSRPRGQGSFHLQPVLLPESAHRLEFMDRLKKHSIQTSIHYPPVHLFRWYRTNAVQTSLPVTETVASRLVSLPLHASMTDEQVDRVCHAVNDIPFPKRPTA
jgi:dTDP-4-amino-4,6-dideoxygalactose transaminase